MDIQLIIVAVIVCLCFAYVGVRIFRSVKRIKNNETLCDCGCGHCAEKASCGCGSRYDQEDAEKINKNSAEKLRN